MIPPGQHDPDFPGISSLVPAFLRSQLRGERDWEKHQPERLIAVFRGFLFSEFRFQSCDEFWQFGSLLCLNERSGLPCGVEHVLKPYAVFMGHTHLRQIAAHLHENSG